MKDLINSKESITGAYISGRKAIDIPSIRRPIDPKRKLTVKGAKENNLKDIDVEIPLRTICSRKLAYLVPENRHSLMTFSMLHSQTN
jgi:excinuclease UvrABC ATPase subunit